MSGADKRDQLDEIRGLSFDDQESNSGCVMDTNDNPNHLNSGPYRSPPPEAVIDI